MRFARFAFALCAFCVPIAFCVLQYVCLSCVLRFSIKTHYIRNATVLPKTLRSSFRVPLRRRVTRRRRRRRPRRRVEALARRPRRRVEALTPPRPPSRRRPCTSSLLATRSWASARAIATRLCSHSLSGRVSRERSAGVARPGSHEQKASKRNLGDLGIWPLNQASRRRQSTQEIKSV